MDKRIQYLLIGLAAGYLYKKYNTGQVGFDNKDINNTQARPETEGEWTWWPDWLKWGG